MTRQQLGGAIRIVVKELGRTKIASGLTARREQLNCGHVIRSAGRTDGSKHRICPECTDAED